MSVELGTIGIAKKHAPAIGINEQGQRQAGEAVGPQYHVGVRLFRGPQHSPEAIAARPFGTQGRPSADPRGGADCGLTVISRALARARLIRLGLAKVA
jgi:hypothetical protein